MTVSRLVICVFGMICVASPVLASASGSKSLDEVCINDMVDQMEKFDMRKFSSVCAHALSAKMNFVNDMCSFHMAAMNHGRPTQQSLAEAVRSQHKWIKTIGMPCYRASMNMLPAFLKPECRADGFSGTATWAMACEKCMRLKCKFSQRPD